MELEGVRYDAFISYRHSEPDSFVAQNIHRRLENFRLPDSIRRKKDIKKTRIERVFRDVEELPLSDNLSDPIGNALLNSEFLIMIATPRLKESRWCMKEVETFLKTHDRDHVLVVLAEGEPEDSFPEILMYEDVEGTDENGNPCIIREEREPLAADVRGADKKEILKNMDTAVTKLCAALFGLNYDDLKQRRREQKIKRIITLSSVIGAAVLAFAIFASVSLLKISRQNKIITAQYDELQDRYALAAARSSETLLKKGRRLDAVYAAASVLPEKEEDGYNAEALRSLTNALEIYDSPSDIVPFMNYDMDTVTESFIISYDGCHIAVSDMAGILRVFDTATGGVLYETEQGTENAAYKYAFCGDDGFVYYREGCIVFHGISDGKDNTVTDGLEDAYVIPSSDDGYVLCWSDDHVYCILPDGQLAYTRDLSEATDSFGFDLASFYADETYFAIVMSDFDEHYCLVCDAKTGDVVNSLAADGFDPPEVYLYGDSVYLGIPDQEGTSSQIYAADIRTSQTLWTADIEDYMNIRFTANDEDLYVCGANMIYVIDRKYGYEKDRYYLTDVPLTLYTDEDGKVCYFSQNAGWFRIDDGNIFELTRSYFPAEPEGYLQECEVRADKICFAFGRADYVACYSMSGNPDAEPVPDIGSETLMAPEYPADISAVSDIPNPGLVRNVFYSDDHEYIVVTQSDSLVRIYDAGTAQPVGEPFETDRDIFRLVRQKEDIYVASGHYSGYILNKDFEIIAKCGALQGSDEDGMILYSASDGKYYKYPYCSYEEILQRAGELLGDYRPSSETALKYNLKQ